MQAPLSVLLGIFASSYLPVVEIEVTGEIERVCELSQTANSFDVGNLGLAGDASLSVGASCNTPFRINVSSANGALVRDEGRAFDGFRDRLPYVLNAELPLDDGKIARIESCTSNELSQAAPCASAASRGASAINSRFDLEVSWQNSPAPLLAGRYSDTLRVTMEPVI